MSEEPTKGTSEPEPPKPPAEHLGFELLSACCHMPWRLFYFPDGSSQLRCLACGHAISAAPLRAFLGQNFSQILKGCYCPEGRPA
jgi:hypothetical protein